MGFETYKLAFVRTPDLKYLCEDINQQNFIKKKEPT